MLKNYWKITLRQLRKNKGYSFLNVFGLSLGMACALLILLWVNDEYSFNRFHRHYSNLYQVMETQAYDGKVFTFAALPGKFAPAARQELPEIKYATRTDWGTKMLFTFGDKGIYEQGLFADPDFLKMFTFPILKGDTSGVLLDPTSVIITDKMAERFFGKNDPIGKTLKVNADQLFTVKAVMGEPPQNSSLRFSWLASFKGYEDRNQWLLTWSNNGIQSFIELREGTDVNRLNAKLHDFISHKDTSAVAKPFLFSIDNWRLRSKFEEGKQAGGRIEFVNIFSIIAMLIIIIACINFMNLATARSEQRAREVGVRKAMGAGRASLIRQFFGESIILALLAMLIAALLVMAALPLFNTLVEKELVFDMANPVIWAGLPLMAVLCGVVAGSYPSLYLSSFNPVTVFKGLRAGKNSAIVYVRKGLVVVQFVISIILIISTIIIYRQLEHVKDRHLGYEKSNVLFMDLQGTMNQHFPAIYHELMATNVVENAAMSNGRVLSIGSSSAGFEWDGKSPGSKVLITMEWATPQYIPTMGMQLKSGRNFYDDISSDSNSLIINETFARLIGKDDPVGKIIIRYGKPMRVAGVVKDFVYNDMYTAPAPLAIFCDTSNVGQLLVRFKAKQDMQKALSKVEAVFKASSPGYPFEYRFLDSEFNNLFKSEMLTGKLSRVFAFLTILISCLGLFGLAAYTAERRTKEIGIRKVLGATVTNLIRLLSMDFLRLVVIASLIAFPLAWWVMHVFLQGYAYRVAIPWWVFVVAGLAAVVIALLTVSFQAIKAAVANPVESLRTE